MKHSFTSESVITGDQGLHMQIRDQPTSRTPFIDAVTRRRQDQTRIYSLPATQGRCVSTYGEIPGLLFSEEFTMWDLTLTADLAQAYELLNSKVSRSYGGPSLVITTGGSAANHLALRAIGPRKKASSGLQFLIWRGSHRSVANTLAHIAGAWPRYLPVRSDPYGATLPPSPADIFDALHQWPETDVVVVTSPTMIGVCADIGGIVHAVKDVNTRMGTNIRVHVDQAWGALHAFSSRLPPSALHAGADTFVTSLHKNVDGAFTGTAVVGVHPNNPDIWKMVRVLRGATGSTSPSSILLSSADAATSRSAQDHAAYVDRIIDDVESLRSDLREITGVFLLEELRGHGLSSDPTKLTFRIDGYSGKALLAALTDQQFRTLIFEGDYVSAHITAPLSGGDGADGERARIVDAVRRVANGTPPKPRAAVDLAAVLTHIPKQLLTPYEALHNYPIETLPLEKVAGRIAAAPIVSVPPGVPIVSYGEEISQEAVHMLQSLCAEGVRIDGIHDGKFVDVDELG